MKEKSENLKLFKNKKDRKPAGRRGKKFRSMFVLMFLGMTLLTVVPIVGIQLFYSSYLISNARQNRVQVLKDYGDNIAGELVNSGYLEGQISELLDTELQDFSGLYNGRAIVVNSAYEVRFDTYGVLTGHYLVTEDSVTAMTGEDKTHYYSSADKLAFTYTIRDDEGNVCGMILFYVSCADLTVTYKSINHTMMGIIVAIACILTLISYFTARKFTKPLQTMASSFNRIAEGHFDEKVELSGFTEMEQLSSAFNVMVEQLKALEDSRQEFVSNVSHELKTPLTSMKVLADSLNSQENVPVEIYQDFMHDIGSEIDRENKIINDLLSLVRMNKTESEPNITHCSINTLLENILKRVRPIADRKNVETVLESYKQVEADCDELKLTLAVTNIVENAIKYNIAGGWVQVTLDADDEYYYINIADSGIGIPEESQDKVFDRFYRVDKARSRETGGTGLGLSISKTIVEMHHGQIKVKSKVDEGTTFSIRIPLVYTSEAKE